MNTGNRFLVYHITSKGEALALQVREHFPEAECLKYSADEVKTAWPTASAMLFIMASGIAVRTIAPLLADKKLDPAVVVMDETASHVVSLIGGHEAGANQLATEIAVALNAEAIITTATDSHGLTPIDVFAKEHGLIIENRDRLAATSVRHLDQGFLTLLNKTTLSLPDDYRAASDSTQTDVIISSSIHKDSEALMLRPKELYLGVGLNSGTSADEIEHAALALFKQEGLSPLSIAGIATHEKKKAEEQGLQEFASRMHARLLGFTTEELNAVEGVAESPAAKKALGVQAVAEPAALFASGANELLAHKVKYENVTLALCSFGRNTLHVVGTGPGSLEHMTPEALRAIHEADVVVGFKSYLTLIEPLLEGKEVISSAMTQEVDRVRRAVELAMEGRNVALVSGGDPGVYAMAGLTYEVVGSMDAPVDIEVLPGISALNACAARLGAPLMHDFCAISLSDRLTPWDVIEKRLEAAASADFIIVLYNPKSKGRKTQIQRAREIILAHRAETTPVGIVTSAMRPDESVMITDLQRMLEHEIGMRSTVVIGNSKTFRWRDCIVTPRGYANKYDL